MKIYAYGFGDCLSKDEMVLHFNDYEFSNNHYENSNLFLFDYCKTFDEVLQRYYFFFKFFSIYCLLFVFLFNLVD